MFGGVSGGTSRPRTRAAGTGGGARPPVGRLLATSTVAVALATAGATLLAALDTAPTTLDARLTDVFFVLALALFLGGGALRVALWEVAGDARDLMTGAALVVLGGCALPLTRVAGLVMGASQTSLLKAMTALATTLVVLTLLVRALNAYSAAGAAHPLRPGRVVLGAVVTGSSVFLGLVALHVGAPAVLESTAVPPPAVRGAVLALAWFAVGLEATMRGAEQPSAARLAPLAGGMAISEVVRVMTVVHPGGTWEVTGAGIVALVACAAVHGALVDLDRACREARPGAVVPVPGVDAGLDAVRRQRTSAVPTALEHLLLGQRPEDPCDFDVRSVVAGVLDTGVAAGLHVEVRGPGLTAHGRPSDLATVLHALLANVAQHGGGPVTVDVAPAGDRVEVRLADSGPGMPLGQVATLFQRGARGPASTGAGLGLHVAHALMQRQGGDLQLRSHVGGCVFAVTLWPAGGPLPAVPGQRRSRRVWGDLTPRTAE